MAVVTAVAGAVAIGAGAVAANKAKKAAEAAGDEKRR